MSRQYIHSNLSLFAILFLVMAMESFGSHSLTPATKKSRPQVTDCSISQTFPEARITVYWKDSDYYTSKLKSSSGVILKESHVAADPRIFPYGSKIKVEGWGEFIVVDTGGAVKRRTAAKKMGKNCPVIDVFFMKRDDALKAARINPSFAKVEVYNPKQQERSS
ncbi:MAG: 3D domain-containing protein [Verrucomicrobiota bacterium]